MFRALVILKSLLDWTINERLHLEQEYSRVAVPFIVLTCPNKLLFLKIKTCALLREKLPQTPVPHDVPYIFGVRLSLLVSEHVATKVTSVPERV